MEIKNTFVRVSGFDQAKQAAKAYVEHMDAQMGACRQMDNDVVYVRCDARGVLNWGNAGCMEGSVQHHTELSLYDLGVPKGHVHAELMAQYAKDAAETDKPWERWEVKGIDDGNWYPIGAYGITWIPDFSYRRKPVDVFYRVSYTLDKLGMPQFSLHVGQKDTPSIADNRWEGSETKWATGVMPFPVDVPRAVQS